MGDKMLIGGKEVDNELLKEYADNVKQQFAMSGQGLMLGITQLDYDREEIHDKILESINEKKYGDFDKALSKYLDDLKETEQWVDGYETKKQ